MSARPALLAASGLVFAFGVLAWSGASAAPGASQSPSPSIRWLPGDPMQLEFRAHRACTWREHAIDITVRLAGGKEPQAERVELDRAWRRTATAADGGLEVLEEPQAVGKSGPGTPNAPAARRVVRISPRGLPLDAAGKPGPARPMELVLPEQKLAARTEFLGQRTYGKVAWSSEAPPDDRFPMAIRTEFDLTGTEVAGGAECLAIAMTAVGEGPTKDGKGKVEYWGRGRVLFDPLRGLIVSRAREVRVDDVVLPPPAKGRQRVHTEVLLDATLAE